MEANAQRSVISVIVLALIFALSPSCTRDDVSVDPWKIDEVEEMSTPDLSSVDASEELSGMGPTALSLAQNRACTLPDPPQACRVQRADEFGDCGEALGAVFDGAQCVPVTGCACTGEDCPLFESVSQCASACSAQGWCQIDKLKYNYRPLGKPPCDGEFCGTVFAMCIKSEVDPSTDLNKVAPNLTPMNCGPGDGVTYCSFEEPGCSREDWCCYTTRGLWDLDATKTTEMCALSLLVTSTNISCLSFE